MVNVIDTIFGQQFGGKPIKGSGIENLKGAITPTIATISAPVIIGSGLISTAAKVSSPIISTGAKSVASSVTKFVSQNPIKSAVGGLIGYGAIKENPKIITEIPSKTASGLVNVGQNVGTLTKQPNVENLLNIYKQNPVIAGGLSAVGLGLTAASVAPLIASASQTSAIKEQTKAYQDYTVKLEQAAAGIGTTKEQVSSMIGAAASPTYPQAVTQLVSYEDKKSVTTKRKTSKKSKDLNSRPINIRNYNIMAAKNG